MTKHISSILVLALLVSACARRMPDLDSSTASRTNTMEEHKLIGGEPAESIVRKQCTEPRPSYYNDRVRDAIESRLKVKSVEVEGTKEFEKGLQSLTSNTPEGVDIISTLFHICQIARNEGFDKETTSHLVELTILRFGTQFTYEERERQALRLERRNKISDFIVTGSNFRRDILMKNPNPSPNGEIKRWAVEVSNYLYDNLGQADAVAFSNPPPGLPITYGLSNENDGLIRWIDERLVVLQEISRSLR